jgi:hypothetical protein
MPAGIVRLRIRFVLILLLFMRARGAECQPDTPASSSVRDTAALIGVSGELKSLRAVPQAVAGRSIKFQDDAGPCRGKARAFAFC